MKWVKEENPYRKIPGLLEKGWISCSVPGESSISKNVDKQPRKLDRNLRRRLATKRTKKMGTLECTWDIGESRGGTERSRKV